ncbi:MAG: ATP-binding protein, partial [Aquabacterium sp.]|nr:ATP-binding protein [Aquabacterium sp.]
NDILDLSKIEAGRLELDICAFNLAETLAQAAEPFLASARGKGLDLRVEAADVDAMFEGDPNRVRQIVANLVSNAVKFTERGAVVVEARRSADGAVIQVRDTGIGMSPDATRRIFDRFAQAEAGTASRYGGTGLGLSICRDLAGLMHGTIGVESSPGQGSCFSLALPLPEGAARQSPPTSDPSEPAGLGDLRVLVAEDNPTNQLVLQHLLAALGDISVTVVDNGAAAIEAYEREAWDLVLMDINMPILDGVAATVEIRCREAAGARPRTPILALTANAMSHQVQSYLAAGLDGVVAKPVDAAALVAAMSRALAANEAEDQGRQLA